MSSIIFHCHKKTNRRFYYPFFPGPAQNTLYRLFVKIFGGRGNEFESKLLVAYEGFFMSFYD